MTLLISKLASLWLCLFSLCLSNFQIIQYSPVPFLAHWNPYNLSISLLMDLKANIGSRMSHLFSLSPGLTSPCWRALTTNDLDLYIVLSSPSEEENLSPNCLVCGAITTTPPTPPRSKWAHYCLYCTQTRLFCSPHLKSVDCRTVYAID